MEKTILALITLWTVGYSISYGIYEYKTGARKAALGVSLLCLTVVIIFWKF